MSNPIADVPKVVRPKVTTGGKIVRSDATKPFVAPRQGPGGYLIQRPNVVYYDDGTIIKRQIPMQTLVPVLSPTGSVQTVDPWIGSSKPIPSSVPAATVTADGKTTEVSVGIPKWVWIAGAIGAFWLLSRKR